MIRWYRVYIDNTGGSFNAPAPGDGFLSDLHPNTFVSGYALVDDSLRTTRAWFRWQRLASYTSMLGNLVSLQVLLRTGLSATSPASEYEFQIALEQSDEPQIHDIVGNVLTGTSAVAFAAAMAFTRASYGLVTFFDPMTKFLGTTELEVGSPFSVDPTTAVTNALANITVTEVTTT